LIQKTQNGVLHVFRLWSNGVNMLMTALNWNIGLWWCIYYD